MSIITKFLDNLFAKIQQSSGISIFDFQIIALDDGTLEEVKGGELVYTPHYQCVISWSQQKWGIVVVYSAGKASKVLRMDKPKYDSYKSAHDECLKAIREHITTQSKETE